MAFVLAGIVFLLTLVWCGVIMLANSMAPAPGVNDMAVSPWLIGGLVLSALIAASHWAPGW